MPRRKTLTDAMIAKLEPKGAGKSYTVPDPALAGHYVRVWRSGAKTFCAVARDPNRKQVWHSMGAADLLTIEQARVEARRVMLAIRGGQSRKGGETVAAVSEQWLKRHVDAKGLRSATETRRYLDRDILSAWGGREFTSIRRGDVAALLDEVEDKAGPVAADNVLKRVSAICAWYQSRHDDYVSPVVKGMRRTSTKERARDRILTDNELRAVWRAASENGTFGAIVRVLLLTGQRRDKVASMRWQDVGIDGTWAIPAETREKGHGGELVLPDAALEIIRKQPRFSDNPFVFAGRGGSHFSGYSKGKAALDAKANISDWRLHDLRRSARSLLERAGVRPDISERVLGHAIPGVEGVYNRHSYRDEKADALRRLAGLIENILRGPLIRMVRIGKRA